MHLPGFVGDLRNRDPSKVALRRACRVAVAVPFTLILLETIPALREQALFGVFATLGLLVFADFGGRLRIRAVPYLLTIVTALPILIVGIWAGQTTWGAMIMMAAVTLLLGLAAVLRGMVAAAQSTLLLATVLAVTSAAPGTQLQVCACWLIGGLIATIAAILLWPARPQMRLRKRLARVYTAAANAIESRWAAPSDDPEAAFAELLSALDDLHGVYDGDLLRPSGLTNADRTLAELVDIAGRICAFLRWTDVTPPGAGAEPRLTEVNGRFARAIGHELRAISRRLMGESHDCSPSRVKRARDVHFREVNEWVADSRADLTSTLLRQRLDDEFPLRLASASAELGAASFGHYDTFTDATLGDQLEHPHRTAWDRIKAQTSFDSPWLRNAIRSAVALALSVGVAKSLALGHEFWIVLGTLTALRFDALGTGRTAWQALIGTSAGVALATVLIVVFSGQTVVWWVMLPIALFLAAYTPGTFSLATGQAGFSLAVLVLFSLLFPATVAVAELRLIDVAIGLVVSLMISLLIWPRGVVATLFARMKRAMEDATDHLVMAMDNIVGGAVDDRILDDFSERASASLDRAQEAFDLAMVQKPPQTLSIAQWSRVANAARHVDVAAHLLPGATHQIRSRGTQRAIPAEIVGPLLDAANDLRERLRSAVEVWDTDHQGTDPAAAADFGRLDTDWVELSGPVLTLRESIDSWLEGQDGWRGKQADPRPAMLTWIGDWTAFIDWNATRLRNDLLAAREGHALA